MNQPIQNTQKLTNFSIPDINEYLGNLKRLILEDKYTISRDESSRKENADFIEDYKINTDKEKEIILGLTYLDFCYAVNNKNPRFPHEILYVFSKTHELDHWGTLENVEIYIKTNLTQTRGGSDVAIVISFHKRNKQITFLFR